MNRKKFLSKLFFGVLIIISILLAAGYFYNVFKQKGQDQKKPTQLECAENLPVDFLAGQVLMIGVRGDDLKSQTALFKQYEVGGAVIMTAPANPDSGIITQFKTDGGVKGVPILISTDEEGGRVQRFSSLGSIPSPQKVASTLSAAQAQEIISEHGTKLKNIGIDMILGPLVDVAPEQGESVLGDRIFSTSPSTVTAYARSYIEGWKQAGLIPVIKHFPGMGSATSNTDFYPAVTPSLSSLKQRDFVPYQELASFAPAVMVGNQNVPGWFSGPASLSQVPISYLKSQLGYENKFIITDSLSAKAITNKITMADATVKAIVAGNDMALVVSPNFKKVPNQTLIAQLKTAIEQAVAKGIIPKRRLAEAVTRKLNVQGISACSISAQF